MRLLIAIWVSGLSTVALNCLLDFYKVSHLVKVEFKPNLILNAKKELRTWNFHWSPRSSRTLYGGTVYMDFSRE